MKIYTLLLFITMSNLFALDINGQNISINVEKTELKSVFSEIESKTSFNFFYNNSLIDVSEKVSLNVKNQDLKRVLTKLLKKTSIDFRFYKDQIVLFPKNNTSISSMIDEILTKEAAQNIPDSTVSESNLESKITLAIQNLITGVVSDESGDPLPGVNILIKGTQKGTQTDFDGKYTIDAKTGDILVFSFVGMITKEVTVGNSPITNVILQNSNVLDEVIVTGYGTRKKSRITSAAENLDVDVIRESPRAAIQNNLQGNISGVQVVASSGQPGATPNVRVRGVGSFNSSAVLYVIDGLQTQSGSVAATINPDDVESITVLKDAAATSIYGVQGANGVVVINTKKGKSGETKVSYSAQTGFGSPTSAQRFQSLNTTEYSELLREGLINAGRVTNDDEAQNFLLNNGFNPNINTNWFDLLTRSAIYKKHNISISGGSDKTTFYISGGYFNQEGVILASDFERINSRLKLNTELSNKIEIGVNLSYNKTITNERPDGGAFANPVRSIYRLRPDISPFNDDGTYNFDFNSTHNPIAQAEQETRKNIRHTILAGANLNYKLTDDLTFESLVNLNQRFDDEFTRFPSGFGSGRPLGEGTQDSNFRFRWLFRNLLRFNKEWKKNNISAFVGYEFQKSRNKFTDLEVSNISDGFEDLTNGSIPVEASTNKTISGINSTFINAEYAYDDKYLISGSLRRDGSSQFSKRNQYGIFWSVGLGWNIAKENFMNSQSIFNDLKLRASYGLNGNDGISGVFNLFSVTSYNEQPGTVFTTIGNEDLVWEKNKPLDIGLDFAILNRRISGSIDWYKRETIDLLRSRSISAANGDTGRNENIGSMENEGFEVSIKTRNIRSKKNGFQWTTYANFTSNRNKITKLEVQQDTGEQSRRIGQDINTFFFRIYAGVDPTNGNALWYTDETRSEVTANYNDANSEVIGGASPDFYAGIRNVVKYKNLSLDFQFYTSWGGLVYDQWARFTNSDGSRTLSSTGNINRRTYERRWQNPGDLTDVPAFVYGNTQTGRSSQTSSRFIYDGSYIRLRDLTLRYDFSKDFLKNVKLSNASIYLRGSNLWTYIKDDRLERDPEAGLDGRLDQEIPITKTALLGINITF